MTSPKSITPQDGRQSTLQSHHVKKIKSALHSYHTKNITVYISVLSHQTHYSLHFSPITPQKTLKSTLQSYHTINITVYTSVLTHPKNITVYTSVQSHPKKKH